MPLATLDSDTSLALRPGDPVPPPAWSPLTASASVTTRDQVAGVRSNRWPGAVCACTGRHFASLYVGWGLKSVDFAPAPPPPPMAQWAEPLLESNELPPKPAPPEEEEEDE